MNAEMTATAGSGHKAHDHESSVVNSALWAAAGDALGWMTELSRGPSGVKHRTGVERVDRTVPWQRVIGGKSGPRVDLPAGTYSDDTQLRLAISRSIRGDGFFDVESFAKIELPVWTGYALGGGLGTKAAAGNLARRTVNWFSNFFESGNQKYVSGGGNGAAMRIQPHIWSSQGLSDQVALNVLRDSLVTHGHPHGFCGAIFHALCVAHALHERRTPAPEDWRRFVESFTDVDRLIALDPQLAAFWRSAWENTCGETTSDALTRMREEALRDLDAVTRVLTEQREKSYRAALEILGCFLPKFRGSGFKTALAAAALAYLHREDESPAPALIIAANELDSDTDTIATMVGAIMGCLTAGEPEWELQDRDYLKSEATRLANIALGRAQDSYTYPDLGRWNPPTNQTASVGLSSDGLVMAGLGSLEARSQEYHAGDAIWQWFALTSGQTILAKRKADLQTHFAPTQLPGDRQNAGPAVHSNAARKKSPPVGQSGFALGGERQSNPEPRLNLDEKTQPVRRPDNLDGWTDAVIHSQFDDLTLGRLLNRCIDMTGTVEAAAAFAGIIAKAKLSRQRRGR